MNSIYSFIAGMFAMAIPIITLLILTTICIKHRDSSRRKADDREMKDWVSREHLK